MYVRAKAIIFIIIILTSICSTCSTAYALDTARHSETISEVATKDLYSFEVLFRWLNSVNISRYCDIKVHSYRDLKNNAIHIFNHIYTEPSLSIFIGALQLRTLKRFAYGSSNIDDRDILNLILTITANFNISISSGRTCGNPFANLLLNILYGDSYCRYRYSDLDTLIEYLVLLGENVSQEYLFSIISKVYTIKIALQGRGIYRDTLENIMDKLLYEESIIVYLLLEDFLSKSNINIIERNPYSSVEQILIEIDKNEVRKPLTIQDVEYILSKAIALASSLKEKGVTISPEDIPKIISYVMSIDSDKIIALLDSIEFGERLRDISIEIVYTFTYVNYSDSENFVNNLTYIGIPFNFIDMYSEENITSFSDLSNSTNINLKFFTDIDTKIPDYIENVEKKLSKYIEKINSINIDMVMSIDTDATSIQSSIEQDNIVKIGRDVSNPLPYTIPLTIYITFSTGISVTILVIVGRKHLLRYILRLLSISNTSIDNIERYAHSQSHFDLFWNLIYSIAHVFGIKISNNETHREIYSKILHKLGNSDKEYKDLLKDIVKGYEILRFSRDIIDRETWLKSIIKMIKLIEHRDRLNA
ncbi:MAG: hypothetical protein QXM82_03025 [Ignisphaera sp.]